MELNRKLAELLGWTDIVEVGGALLGKPPEGQPECRGQARVPDWAGDWGACGLLLARHFGITNAELRIKIVKSEIDKLEGKNG